jgi:hypothetical protein
MRTIKNYIRIDQQAVNFFKCLAFIRNHNMHFGLSHHLKMLCFYDIIGQNIMIYG